MTSGLTAHTGMASIGRLRMTICLVVLTVYTVSGHSIAKRNALQLCGLMQHYTGISCLAYNNYGCYCGKGQVAVTPRDAVDRCCQIHDDCYGMVDDGGYCWLDNLLVPYAATCSSTGCSCSTWQWTCPYEVCKCDLNFAKCLATATYHEKYAGYDTRKCV